MADNLSIESPDFDAIRRGDDIATKNAIQLLWFVLNDTIGRFRRLTRVATEQENLKVRSVAPAAQQDDFDPQGSAILLFTGSTNFTLTGIRAGSEGTRLTLQNIGSATITLADDSASSDSSNRIFTADGNNKSLATNKTVVLHYLSSAWREMSLA